MGEGSVRQTAEAGRRTEPLHQHHHRTDGDAAPNVDPTTEIEYNDVVLEADNFRAINARRAETARENTEYLFEAVSDAEREAEEAKPFVPNEGQQHNKMTKSASKAVRETFGNAVYDEITEMNRGKVEDRKVVLHHALGTKHQKEGHPVLEMEFAGTTGKDVMKKHKDRNGSIDTTLPPEEYKARYGTEALKGREKQPEAKKEEPPEAKNEGKQAVVPAAPGV